MDSMISSASICEGILSIREQNTIYNAALLAHGDQHVQAERHRCFAGYDIGVMAAERKAGR